MQILGRLTPQARRFAQAASAPESPDLGVTLGLDLRVHYSRTSLSYEDDGLRCQRRPAPGSTRVKNALARRDILRAVEAIAGVELRFDIAQPRIDFGRIGCAHAHF